MAVLHRRVRHWLAGLAVCGLFWGCGEQVQKEPASVPANQVEEAPTGSWFMYGGSASGIRQAEDLDEEMTLLLLADSTYTLTMMQPNIQVHFVEQGKVNYDLRNKLMRFSVFTSTGVDFSGDEPRKMIDVTEVMPWDREPGTIYVMEWAMDREYMILSAEEHEDSYFVRMEQSDGALDARMGKNGD